MDGSDAFPGVGIKGLMGLLLGPKPKGCLWASHASGRMHACKSMTDMRMYACMPFLQQDAFPAF